MKTELDESGLHGIARWRFVAVLIALGLLLLAILVRLVMLHTVDQPFLFEEGEKRMVRTQIETARRGMITDRFGNPLAVSTPVVDIGLHPAQLDIARLPEIARILGRQPDALVKTVRDAAARGRSFIYLDRQVEPDIAQAIADLGIDGVQMQEGFRRFYPAAEVASHVVGIVDIDNHGQEGL
jgi:cell division protein FtsI (penicillin-binding protein 3)